MNRGFHKTAKIIISFDKWLRLCGIFSSYMTVEQMTGIRHQVVQACCDGSLISTKKMYWREVPDDIVIDIDDLQKLTLIEFDSQLGENRMIYKSSRMKKGDNILESEYIKNKENGKG